MLSLIREPCSSLQNIVPPATIWQAPQWHSKVGWRKDPRPGTQRAVSVISDNFYLQNVVPPLDLLLAALRGAEHVDETWEVPLERV